MKKVIIADFVEYNEPSKKLGNYHYANCFAKYGYEVLWVSNLFNELVYLKNKNDYKYKNSISSAEKHELSKNIYGYAPYSLLLYGNYFFSKNANIVLNNEKYILPDIKETLKKLNFYNADILWISNPKHYWLTNVVNYNKLVFRIPDDFNNHTSFPASVAEIENKLIDKADYIFITSKLLQEKVENRNKKSYLLNNGVDFEHFNQSKTFFPKEYNRDKKRIVYVGTISNWFDLKLIKKISQSVAADIYIIGDSGIDLNLIKKSGNVHILGKRPYSIIPSYLKNADIAIIPFIKNSLTDAVSPIKLYEYCSAGAAVVSSNLKEIINTNAPIYIAKDDNDFIAGIKNYLKYGHDRDKSVSFGKKNSWESRYQDAIKIINNR